MTLPGGSATATAAATPQTVTGYPDWEYKLLAKLGAPATGVNLYGLSLWAQSEGVVSSNNYLAVCCIAAGSSGVIAQNGTTAPIYGYASEDDGVAANAQFIQENTPGIQQVLQQGNSLTGLWQAINQSGWCKGCQSGHYPVDLYNALSGPIPTSGKGLNTNTAGVPITQEQSCLIGIGGTCFFSISQWKALKGALLLIAGGGMMLTGGLVITSFAFLRTPAGAAARQAVKATPLGAAVSSRSSSSAGQRSAPSGPASVPERDLPTREPGESGAAYTERLRAN